MPESTMNQSDIGKNKIPSPSIDGSAAPAGESTKKILGGMPPTRTQAEDIKLTSSPKKAPGSVRS